MWVVYDFETSTKELLGQITAYSFHLLDSEWQLIDRLTGYVQLNRTEIPDLDATLITQLSPYFLNKNGLPEPVVARLIFQFLSTCVIRYGHVNLVGYNANHFDLKFLRSLLIRYGYNPYFYGKIKNIDAYHFAQYVALANPETFPWQTDENGNWQFKLETIARRHGLLSAAQRHDADADVALLRSTIATLEQRYGTPLHGFKGVVIPEQTTDRSILVQSVKGVPPDKVSNRFWVLLHHSKSELIVADIGKVIDARIQTETDLLNCCRYVNPNTHFFHAGVAFDPLPCKVQGALTQICESADQFGFSKTWYFDHKKPNWDIQYRIHDLGFERIDAIGKLIRQFNANWEDAHRVLTQLWHDASAEKDQFLVQLLSRYIINHSPTPSRSTIKKYASARYVVGQLVRNPSDFNPIFSQLADAKEKAKITESQILTDYISYVSEQIDRLGIGPASSDAGPP